MKAVTVLLTTVLVLSAAPTSAALVEVDLFAPGDALITEDKEANLQWLDVSATFGSSFDQVLNRLGYSWYDDG